MGKDLTEILTIIFLDVKGQFFVVTSDQYVKLFRLHYTFSLCM
jgi:hypothetical protein